MAHPKFDFFPLNRSVSPSIEGKFFMSNCISKAALVAYLISAGFVSAETYQTSASASGGLNGNPVCGAAYIDTETTPDGESVAVYTQADTGCTASSVAAGGAGFVGASSDYNLTGNNNSGFTRGTASFVTGDLTIDIADGFTEAFVSNLYPNGTVEVTLAAKFDGSLSANSSSANSLSVFLSRARGLVVFGSAVYEELITAGTDFGSASDLDIFNRTIRLTQDVAWGAPLSVQMVVTSDASGISNFDGVTGSASADASQTLSFDPDGPAFILPEYFTVNAPELNIFNNRWIDPRSAPAVPIPASLPWLLAGALMLAGVARIRRKSSC